MLHETIPFLPASESAYDDSSRSTWVYFPDHLLRNTETEQRPEAPPAKPCLPAHHCEGVLREDKETDGRDVLGFDKGPSLFQEVFFFCTVKGVGDIPGAGCIYVETVVEREAGIAFAKVYSAKNAINAVNILESRVVPFFKHRGIAIKEIHTRKTNEYCGMPFGHPFEAFLATSRIQHLPMDLPGHPHNQLCERFYRLLLKEFFLPALRKKFKVSLDELQKDLDAFVESYNALHMEKNGELKAALILQRISLLTCDLVVILLCPDFSTAQDSLEIPAGQTLL